jgi:hypothetical protein
MGRWKVRDPSLYPINFAATVEQAYESKQPAYLQTFKDEYSARVGLDRFREWRFCIRNFKSNHRCRHIEFGSRIATKLKPVLTGFEAWVIVHPLMIDSMLKLNPEHHDLIETVLAEG